MKTFTETKRIEQGRPPHGGVVSGDEGVKPFTEPNSRVTMPGHHNNSSSSGSSTRNNNANQCVNTLAIVEDRQCSSPFVDDLLNLPMTRSPQPLSMASSLSTSNDAAMCHNLIKESISSSANVSKNNEEISQRRETTEDAIAIILPNQKSQSIAAPVSINDMSGDAIKEASESHEIIIIQPLNMDAIEMDNLSPPASTVDKIASKMKTSTNVDIEQNQNSILTRICNKL